jgi:sugar/nucleoside kinase (ribokinase family)
VGAAAPGLQPIAVPAEPPIPQAVVAGHVCLDVVPALHGPVALEPGQLVEVGPAAFSTGGAVGNAGLALHRLGVRVGLLAKVGDDVLGAAVLDALRREGEGLADGIRVAAGEATSYSIVISPPGLDRSFLHCSGANETLSAADVTAAELAGVAVFHLGYPPLMPRLYADGGAGLADLYARLRAQGTATSLDLARFGPDSAAARVDWRAFLARVLPSVDVFAPSLDDLAPVPGLPSEPVALGEALLELGATVVALKLGERGLYLCAAADDRVPAFAGRLGLDADEWRGAELHEPCFAPRAVAGTTGSGDATIAGLLAALLRGAGPEPAATAAVAVGACSVEGPDPTSAIPPWPAIAARIAAGWPRLLER